MALFRYLEDRLFQHGITVYISRECQRVSIRSICALLIRDK